MGAPSRKMYDAIAAAVKDCRERCLSNPDTRAAHELIVQLQKQLSAVFAATNQNFQPDRFANSCTPLNTFRKPEQPAAVSQSSNSYKKGLAAADELVPHFLKQQAD